MLYFDDMKNPSSGFWGKFWLYRARKSDDESLAEALNSLDLALIYFDVDGKLKTANCKACELIPRLGGQVNNLSEKCRGCKTQRQCEEIEEPIKTFDHLISFIFDHSVDAKEQIGLFLDHSQSPTTVFREVIKTDQDRFYLVRAVPQKNKGTIVELTDISGMKSKNDHLFELGKQNHILTEAIQTSKAGVFIAENNTDDKKILFLNQALSSLLQHECQNYLGTSVLAFLQEEFSEEYNDLEKSIRSKEKTSIWKTLLDEKNQPVWLDLNLYPTGQDGNLMIGVLSDETQNKLQESHLRQTQKLEAIGHLAGGVAHDFNNILAIIEGYSRMAETSWKRGEDISEKMARIFQAVQRGSGLTRQLLTFGKHRITESKTIDLCVQIKEIESLLMPLLGVDIKLETKIHAHHIYIMATADIISQIIMNLSINARDAMPDGGTITIETMAMKREDCGDGYLLKISDTGTGMTQDVMEKMFDPFFTTKEQGKGTGLGLSMVYGLVQQLGGEMNVDSEIGKGTCFSIWLPESQEIPHEKEINDGKSEESNGALQGKVVVLAEDEPDLLEIMKETLEGFGMIVMKAANGNEALEVQDGYDGEIDFLLTDMVMPELGGLQLAELFHEIRPETRIVFMSGYPVRGEISQINLPEGSIFMAKPIMRKDLKMVMEKVANGQEVQTISGVMWES